MNEEKKKTGPVGRPFFVGAPTSFLNAFPEVTKFTLTVREFGASQKFEPERYTEADMPAGIRCRNPKCWLGGLRLQPFLRKIFAELQKQGKTEFEKSALCCGHEGWKVKPYHRCYHSFTVKGRVEFKKAGKK